jgi:hypothetical protein
MNPGRKPAAPLALVPRLKRCAILVIDRCARLMALPDPEWVPDVPTARPDMKYLYRICDCRKIGIAFSGYLHKTVLGGKQHSLRRICPQVQAHPWCRNSACCNRSRTPGVSLNLPSSEDCYAAHCLLSPSPGGRSRSPTAPSTTPTLAWPCRQGQSVAVTGPVFNCYPQ